MLVPDRKICFIHVPKTGGSTVERLLCQHFKCGFAQYWKNWADRLDANLNANLLEQASRSGVHRPYPAQHWTFTDVQEFIPDLPTWFCFAFVRNPWARLYSEWRYVRAYERIQSDFGFDEFVRRSLTQPVHNQHRKQHLRPQIEFVHPSMRVLRFESFASEIRAVFKQLGVEAEAIPHELNTGDANEWRVAYTPSLASLVGRFYQKDLAAFGYTSDSIVFPGTASPANKYGSFTRQEACGNNSPSQRSISPAPTPSGLLLPTPGWEDTTAIVKTLLRPQSLKAMIDSLLAFYPRMKVLIGDDSPEPYAQEMAAEWRRKGYNITGYHFTRDVGIGRGRNLLLAHVDTPLFLLLDDDFVFTPETNLSLLKQAIDVGFDLAGGTVFEGTQEIRWAGNFEREGDRLFGHQLEKYTDPWSTVDCVQNFFLARTEKIRCVGGWDPDLKVCEHTDFFYRSKLAGLKVAQVANCPIQHRPDRTGKYGTFRNRPRFMHLWMKKWNISEWRSFSGHKNIRIKPPSFTRGVHSTDKESPGLRSPLDAISRCKGNAERTGGNSRTDIYLRLRRP